MVRACIAAVLFLATFRSPTVASEPQNELKNESPVTDNLPPREKLREEYEAEYMRTESDFKKSKLADIYKKNKECEENGEWACSRPCREQRPPSNSSQCIDPTVEDMCFGVKIDYMYVKRPFDFPSNLEVLRRFPTCFSYLGPLACSVYYRPCGEYKYATTATGDRPSKIELYQRFRVDGCINTRKYCADVIEEGLFPDWIRCEDTAEEVKRLNDKKSEEEERKYRGEWKIEEAFTDVEWQRQGTFTSANCKILYSEAPSTLPQQQCLFPLVHADHVDLKPVIDRCYLPCRSALVSSSLRYASFDTFRLVFAGAFFIFGIGIFMYLACFSSVYESQLSIFAVSHSLLSGGLYCLLWALASFSVISNSAECEPATGGILLRRPLGGEHPFEWCVLNSLFLHSTLLAALWWQVVALVASASPLVPLTTSLCKLGTRCRMNTLQCNQMDVRPVCCILVYISTFGVAALGTILSMRETDGASGVCMIGLHSLSSFALLIVLPTVLFAIVGFLVARRARSAEDALVKQCEEEMVQARLAEAEESAKVHRRVEKLLAQGVSPDDISAEQRADESLDEKGEELLSDERRLKIEADVRDEERDNVEHNRRQHWREAIPASWTLMAVIISLSGLVIAMIVHWAVLWREPNAEEQAVREYVKCVMHSSYSKNDTHWLKGASEPWMDGLTEADPLKRRQRLQSNITPLGCTLPTWGDARLSGILFVFLILPMAPLLVYIVAFFAGLAGHCGMRRANVIKKRFTPFEKEDREMIELTAADYDATQDADDERSGGGDDCYSVSVRGNRQPFRSSEKIQITAPSPVPSHCRSEQPPQARAHSTGHIRRLDLISRQVQHRQRRRVLSRATSEEGGRREREQGQLARPRSQSTMAQPPPHPPPPQRAEVQNRCPPRYTEAGRRDPWTSDSSENMTSVSQRGRVVPPEGPPGRIMIGPDGNILGGLNMGIPPAVAHQLYAAGLREGALLERCRKYGARIGELSNSLALAASRMRSSAEEQFHDTVLLRRAADHVQRLRGLVPMDSEGEVIRETNELLRELELTLQKRAAAVTGGCSDNAGPSINVENGDSGPYVTFPPTHGVKFHPSTPPASTSNGPVYPPFTMVDLSQPPPHNGNEDEGESSMTPSSMDELHRPGLANGAPSPLANQEQQPIGTFYMNGVPYAPPTGHFRAPVASTVQSRDGSGVGGTNEDLRRISGLPMSSETSADESIGRSNVFRGFRFPTPDKNSIMTTQTDATQLSNVTILTKSLKERQVAERVAAVNREARMRMNGNSSSDSTSPEFDRQQRETVKQRGSQESQPTSSTSGSASVVAGLVGGSRQSDIGRSNSSGYSSTVNGFGAGTIRDSPVEQNNVVEEEEEEVMEEMEGGWMNGDRQRIERAREEEEERRREEEEADRPGPSGLQRQLEEERKRRLEILGGKSASTPSLASSMGKSSKSSSSISSTLSPEEEERLIAALQTALNAQAESGQMSEDDRRLVEHLRRALDTHGGIGRDDIMRWKVAEMAQESLRRQRNENTPFSVSHVVVSRLSRRELELRVQAIREMSSVPLYRLEIFYALQLSDALWILEERSIVHGDSIYSQHEMNEILGEDPEEIPPNTDRHNFHQLMRKRAISAVTIAGREFGRNGQTPQYVPAPMPELSLNNLGGSSAVMQALHGDFSGIRRALEELPFSAPDVMRLDSQHEHLLGNHLRHFRDYLDRYSASRGYPVRSCTHLSRDIDDPEGTRVFPNMTETANLVASAPSQLNRSGNGETNEERNMGGAVEEDNGEEPSNESPPPEGI